MQTNNTRSSRQKGSAETQRIASLITNFRQRTISLAEHAELQRWINASEENQLLFQDIIFKKTSDLNTSPPASKASAAGKTSLLWLLVLIALLTLVAVHFFLRGV